MEHNEVHENLEQRLAQVQDFQVMAELFKHLGDATRLRIFWLLCHREICVADIAELLHMSAPAISHHLRPLRVAGLITSHREGREVMYRASQSIAAQTLHRMIEQVMQFTCPDL
jgi:ArsR family transcriptional regulator, lead/cadmium/zinc/bismuth-responsive transcriptional repressor